MLSSAKGKDRKVCEWEASYGRWPGKSQSTRAGFLCRFKSVPLPRSHPLLSQSSFPSWIRRQITFEVEIPFINYIYKCQGPLQMGNFYCFQSFSYAAVSQNINWKKHILMPKRHILGSCPLLPLITKNEWLFATKTSWSLILQYIWWMCCMPCLDPRGILGQVNVNNGCTFLRKLQDISNY